MAVFHYCAESGSRRLDGLIGSDATDQEMLEGAWLEGFRATVAGLFEPAVEPNAVAITSLTRIGG